MYNIREGCFVLTASFHNKTTGLDFLLLNIKFVIIKRNHEWIVSQLRLLGNVIERGSFKIRWHHRRPKLTLRGRVTYHRWRAGVALQATVENRRDFVWEIYCWDLRTLNNTKPYFLLIEMNKKDLPAMYSTAFWCLFVVLLFCSLLRNHCYSNELWD